MEPIPVSECKLKFLVPGNDPTNTPEELARLDNKRIATSFPLVVEQWLSGKGIKGMEIIEVDGKVESWVRDGIAGAACDLVEKGETAKRYGLRQTDMVVFDSSSLIVRTDRHRGAANEAVMERFSGRLYAAARALKGPSA